MGYSQALLDGLENIPEDIQYHKNYQTLGKSVRNLPVFKFLTHTYLVDARTPGQWAPYEYQATLTDRFGESHLGITTLGITDNSCTTTTTLQRILDEGSLEKDMHKAAEGSVFAHFYHGLSKEIKEHIR